MSDDGKRQQGDGSSPSPTGRGSGGGPRASQPRNAAGHISRRQPRDPVLVERSRELRNGASKAERLLWLQLRARRLLGWKFSRQIATEGYIADFACRERRLIVELDGGQHGRDDAPVYDERRDARLRAAGWIVLRFWNREVFTNTEGVVRRIVDALGGPPPGPLPAGEGEQR